MRKRIITTIAVCATGLVLSAFGQNSSSTTGGSSTDQSTSPAGSSGFDQTRRSPTGRMGQETRASKLMNAEVKSSQGQTVGTISDLVLNPSSGRIDFAVISANSAGSLGSSSQSSTSPSSTTSSQSTTSSSDSSSGKLVAVPWTLLRPSSSSSSISSSSSTTSSSSSSSSGLSGQPTFVFAGDPSKLMSAPSFDSSNWPDISQYSWRQSIYSHFGMTPGTSTGGATSPGGFDSSTGSSSSSSPGNNSSTPPSPSPSSPNSSGK